MYFPYVRGRQYELLALSELVAEELISDYVIPVVEPVKLSATLINTIAEYLKASHSISIIENPSVGTFLKDLGSAKEGSREERYKKTFSDQCNDAKIIKSFIMKDKVDVLIDAIKKNNNIEDLLIINTDRDLLNLYENIFDKTAPKYVLIPDEGAFRRKMKNHKVLLNDKFEKQNRNSDYKEIKDEFFSDDHLFYKDDGFLGFSDYSVIGKEYMEAGFAPYAVAIHIVYFASDKTLRVKHFVSESNEDIKNPAGKFYEAVSKLAAWHDRCGVGMTLGLRRFLEHYERQTYPGLGTVKKLSLMHHLELMSNYLNGDC